MTSPNARVSPDRILLAQVERTHDVDGRCSRVLRKTNVESVVLGGATELPLAHRNQARARVLALRKHPTYLASRN